MNTTPTKKTGAGLARFRSKQDYATPMEFINAVEKRFGTIAVDLAASPENAKSVTYWTKEQDSLAQPWYQFPGLLWLNCPFSNITPWAKKCSEEAEKGARILFLTPASVGSEWFAKYVDGKAHVLLLRPRLSFDGKNPYPKDCILSCYNAGPIKAGYECWNWKDGAL